MSAHSTEVGKREGKERKKKTQITHPNCNEFLFCFNIISFPPLNRRLMCTAPMAVGRERRPRHRIERVTIFPIKTFRACMPSNWCQRNADASVPCRILCPQARIRMDWGSLSESIRTSACKTDGATANVQEEVKWTHESTYCSLFSVGAFHFSLVFAVGRFFQMCLLLIR